MAVSAGSVADPVAQVADTFVELMRTFQRAKARYLADDQHDVEWSTQVLLRVIAHNGPMRASEVAGCLRSDPSTVSRQVAAMVRDGLLERRSDPEDGRASILALTTKADDVLAAHEQQRLARFESMLSDWSPSDLSRFAKLLRRFTEDFERSSSALVTDHSGPHSQPSGPAERKQ